jgi:hypothetical protein
MNMRKYIASETIRKGQFMYFDHKTGTVRPVEVAKPKGSQVTDTWYDEMTQMTQEHNFIIQERGAGKKEFMEWIEAHQHDSQPVPFSKEYYGFNDAGIPTEVPCFISDSHPYVVVPLKYKKEAQKFYNKPEKRKWTEAEIEEAKRYVADKMYELTKDSMFLMFYECTSHPNKEVAQLYQDKGNLKLGGFATKGLNVNAVEVKTCIASCCPTDTFNTAIGKMVAVKKMFGEPLPTWLYGGKK